MTGIGLFELIVGFLSGSLGLIGDAVDSFADAATSFVVWFGLRLSKRGPDAKFHFGYLKAETLYSMLGAIIIAGVGLVVMYESYATLNTMRELKYGTSAAGNEYARRHPSPEAFCPWMLQNFCLSERVD